MPETPTPAEVAYEAWVRSKEHPMPDTPTPGQICYAAHYAAQPWQSPWNYLTARQQAAWETAAQAVLVDTLAHWRAREAAALRYVGAVIRHWNEFGPGLGFAEHMNALETWLEAQPQEDTPDA